MTAQRRLMLESLEVRATPAGLLATPVSLAGVGMVANQVIAAAAVVSREASAAPVVQTATATVQVMSSAVSVVNGSQPGAAAGIVPPAPVHQGGASALTATPTPGSAVPGAAIERPGDGSVEPTPGAPLAAPVAGGNVIGAAGLSFPRPVEARSGVGPALSRTVGPLDLSQPAGLSLVGRPAPLDQGFSSSTGDDTTEEAAADQAADPGDGGAVADGVQASAEREWGGDDEAVRPAVFEATGAEIVEQAFDEAGETSGWKERYQQGWWLMGLAVAGTVLEAARRCGGEQAAEQAHRPTLTPES